MKPTSALTEFAQPLASSYESLLNDHHSRTLQKHCFSCRMAAEAIFQQALRKWEWFVKEVIIDEMCGAVPIRPGWIRGVPVVKFYSRSSARDELLRSRYRAQSNAVVLSAYPANYLLLHNPNTVAAIAAKWVAGSALENVFRSYRMDIGRVLKLRHGLAHGTQHAQLEARATMLQYAPLSVSATVGEFLIDSPQIGAPIWLEFLFGQLCGWAGEMSP